jgi:glutathione synthase/RimK-type ligase-like ATP-grasp enzyme
MLNPPELVGIASNKLQFFEQLSAVDTTVLPEFWKIAALIPDDRFPIVCRTVLSGHSGQGIVIAESRQELVPAPLYVKYIKKQDEYRVHVGNPNTIILVQRKARRLETATEDVNWQVRNHHNGFVFTRSGFDTPEAVSKAAMDAMRILGLDFGAVDVVYNSRENRAYVLEVNTAPGLEGSTVDDYANYFVGRTTNG